MKTERTGKKKETALRAAQGEKTCAIVTGATGVLGGAFVRELLKKEEIFCGEQALFLTGRSEEKLAALKARVSEKAPKSEVYVCACDLSSEESRAALFRALDNIRENGVKIARLVNVAGADVQKAFALYTQEKLFFQCRANFEGAAALCLYAVQHAAKKAEIINISSVSGIYPMPYFAVYSATKGALTSFSLALREEVKSQGIRVCAILPGAMPTREDVKAQIAGQGLWGKLAALPPETVARKSIRAAEKGKGKVVVGFFNKLMNVSTRLLPASLRTRYIKKRWSKISKDAF